MPYCPKCGKKVSEEINYCPNCGANLRLKRPYPISVRREKGEKEETSPAILLAIGLILILVGILSVIINLGITILQRAWPYFLFLLGLLIIVAAVVAGVTAARRHPHPLKEPAE